MVVGCWLLVVGCWLLVVGCWLLVVSCWLLVVGRRLVTFPIIQQNNKITKQQNNKTASRLKTF